MKTLCLSAQNLNELMSAIYQTTSEVVFCEEKEIEIVRISPEREIALEDTFEEIDARFNVEVSSFDVMDLGELGEAFVFFLK